MEISLNAVVFAVIAGSLLFAGFATLFSRFVQISAEKRLKKLRVTCRLCGMIFVAEHEAALVHCRHCDKLNLHRHNGPLG